MTPSSYARRLRLRRLFSRPSGRAAIVAWAHGPLVGPIPGLRSEEAPRVGEALARADGLVLSPAVLPAVAEVLARRDRPSVFLLHRWQSVSRPPELLGYEEGATATLCSVEEAARWGADGVMTYLYVGWRDPLREAREVEAVAEAARRCQELGMLLMVESRSIRAERDASGLARGDLACYHARLAAELGADLVKTPWTGPEAFREVVAGCPVPLLVSGGRRVGPLADAVDRAREAVACGAAGVVYGRYVFQDPDPAAALDALLEVVHGRSA